MRHAWAGRKPVRTVAACLLLWAGAILPARANGPKEQALLARGDYLVHIMDCSGCHTYGALAGPPDMTRFLGGSDTGFEIPGLGVFYPPNLTPDPATGLGRWRRANRPPGGDRPSGSGPPES